MSHLLQDVRTYCWQVLRTPLTSERRLMSSEVGTWSRSSACVASETRIMKSPETRISREKIDKRTCSQLENYSKCRKTRHNRTPCVFKLHVNIASRVLSFLRPYTVYSVRTYRLNVRVHVRKCLCFKTFLNIMKSTKFLCKNFQALLTIPSLFLCLQSRCMQT